MEVTLAKKVDPRGIGGVIVTWADAQSSRVPPWLQALTIETRAWRVFQMASSTNMHPVHALWRFGLKPVLNWANVCSPNILRTVRRTMIRFLIELLVRRTWFGQSKLYFVLKFRYPFHPRVTTVARKRSRSFCQKCRWQVTAKHAYTLRMWLCMKWHGAWLYGVHRTCAEMAAVSCGTSHASAVSTPLRWIFKKTRYKS